MTATTNALAAFAAATADIEALATTLAARARDHLGATPDEVTWGHVGTAQAARDRLREALAALDGTA